jgi:restriction system protein
MTTPDYQTLMLPVLRIAARGETRVPDLEEEIANQFGLSEEERAQLLRSGRQKLLHNRIHWAKFYMTKAGLIDSPRRGRFVASDAGRALLAQNPHRIDVNRLLQYPAFVAFYRNGTSAADDAAVEEAVVRPSIMSTPEDQIEAAVTTLQHALSADLLARILENTPSFFEQVIVDLLVAMGYGGDRRNAARRLGKSNDGGVDGVIDEDRLGLDRIYVQAKRYAPGTTVGRPEVQGFVGSLVGLGAHKGVFVTTSSFSQGAIDYARHLSQRVILIDGQRLAELMIEQNVGVRVSRTVEVKRLDEDFFTDEG